MPLGICVALKKIQARALPARSETEPPILAVSVTDSQGVGVAGAGRLERIY